MDYKVVVTRDAEEDLERFTKYFIIEKKSMQSADSFLSAALVMENKESLWYNPNCG